MTPAEVTLKLDSLAPPVAVKVAAPTLPVTARVALNVVFDASTVVLPVLDAVVWVMVPAWMITFAPEMVATVSPEVAILKLLAGYVAAAGF
jgi:hypothetical protein